MLCAEGAGPQPPKYDRRFCEKLATTSLSPLTVLDCLYRNLASDRIFSTQLPLAFGSESMRISAPNPEIGAPELGKIWGLVQKSLCVFCSGFWHVHSLLEVLWACEILDGSITPFLRYLKKRRCAVDFGTKCRLWLQLAAPFRMIAYSICTICFTGPI